MVYSTDLLAAFYYCVCKYHHSFSRRANIKKKIKFRFSRLQCHSDTIFINTECGGVVRAINLISFLWSFFFSQRNSVRYIFWKSNKNFEQVRTINLVLLNPTEKNCLWNVLITTDNDSRPPSHLPSPLPPSLHWRQINNYGSTVELSWPKLLL